jgi:RimJ/RimL family protein N-acetyltransferase
MSKEMNHLGQPMSFAVDNWSERQRPPGTPMRGQFCRVVQLEPERHAADLYAANNEDREGRMWTYLACGPFSSFEEYFAGLNQWCLKEDWRIHAILDEPNGMASGLASYMHIEPRYGSIEVGAVMYSPRLQRTRAGTEAMYLLMRRAFDELGYRRYEWKCNALNEASAYAAKRLGFQFEGIFRQATAVKGYNRDTAWFSVIDRDWPQVKAAFEAWLGPGNFDSNGRQRRSLSQIRNQL